MKHAFLDDICMYCGKHWHAVIGTECKGDKDE
jgi:hypothetical protein